MEHKINFVTKLIWNENYLNWVNPESKSVWYKHKSKVKINQQTKLFRKEITAKYWEKKTLMQKQI